MDIASDAVHQVTTQVNEALNARPQPQPTEDVTFGAKLFEWTSTVTSWFFFRMPADQSAELREQMDGLTKGFGSIRVEATIGDSIWQTSVLVEATIGDSIWQTSVFPEGSTKQYMLPVKAAIRTAQGLLAGESVGISVRVLVS
jgi:Domain of unknown function (DUF1905)